MLAAKEKREKSKDVKSAGPSYYSLWYLVRLLINNKQTTLKLVWRVPWSLYRSSCKENTFNLPKENTFYLPLLLYLVLEEEESGGK